VGISPYLRRLREAVGRELLLVPSVAVLVWEEDSRLLLVRDAETGRWQTIGGAIEPDESPQEAALRETREEVGAVVRIERIRAVLGGPQFRLTYANGDEVAYVPTVFDARIITGVPRPDGEETLEVRWFTTQDLAQASLTHFTHALFEAAGVAAATAETVSRAPSS
jgi:8-oxo-dGTP pyrophosphatase MutT (NUDIX family)